MADMFKAITRLFQPMPLTAELKRGHLYIGIYLRPNSAKRPENKKFHVLLATVDPTNPRMIKKYHARNPINTETVSQEWKYEIEDQVIPSDGLVAFVQISSKAQWADVHHRVQLKTIPLVVPAWMDSEEYPAFTCKVWLMEALRWISFTSRKDLDIPKLMAEIQAIGMKHLDPVMKYNKPIPVIPSSIFCD